MRLDVTAPRAGRGAVGTGLRRPASALSCSGRRAARWPPGGPPPARPCASSSSAPHREHLSLAIAVALASGLANWTGGRGLGISLVFGLSNAAEAYVVATLLRRRRTTPPPLDSPDDFFRLLAACALGAIVAGAGIGLSVEVTGGDGFMAMRTVAPSHLASTLLVLPFALVWHHPVRLGRTAPGAGPPDRAARHRAAVRLRRRADARPRVLPAAVAGLVGAAVRDAGDQRRAADHGRDQHVWHRTRPRTVRCRRRPGGALPRAGDHPGADVPGLRRPADLPAVPGGRPARRASAPAARRAGSWCRARWRPPRRSS